MRIRVEPVDGALHEPALMNLEQCFQRESRAVVEVWVVQRLMDVVAAGVT